MAENLGKNGKSNRRKGFLRASAVVIRRNGDGTACFHPVLDLKLDNGHSGRREGADFLANPLKVVFTHGERSKSGVMSTGLCRGGANVS